MTHSLTKFFAALIIGAFALSGCSSANQSDVVTAGSTAGKVMYGTVVSSRSVTIKESKNLSDNALGGIGGGVAGGIAGSTIGGGKGQDVATVGGVLAGAVLGAVIQDQLSTTKGFEYIVELDAPKASSSKTKRSLRTERGSKNAVEEDIQDSVVMDERASDALSVIQKDETPIAIGTRVMVIMRDDGTRIVPSVR